MQKINCHWTTVFFSLLQTLSIFRLYVISCNICNNTRYITKTRQLKKSSRSLIKVISVGLGWLIDDWLAFDWLILRSISCRKIRASWNFYGSQGLAASRRFDADKAIITWKSFRCMKFRRNSKRSANISMRWGKVRISIRHCRERSL